MLEMLKDLFDKGYQFIEESYYGEDAIDDFQEVEEAYQIAQDDEYSYFEYEIDESQKVVSYMVQSED